MTHDRDEHGSDKVRSLYSAIAPIYDWEAIAGGFLETRLEFDFT